jgi:GntR family transcriptional regulator of arabinose operon
MNNHIVENGQKKYLFIKQEIKSWILSGKLKAHDQLKTEVELAQSFNISRQTVRKAIGELVNEGRLYRVQGKGTFVTNWVKSMPSDTRNIGMITTYLFNYIFPNIINGVEEVLHKKEYGIFVSSTNNDFDKEREVLESFLSKPLQGLIIEPTLCALPNPNIDYYLTLEERGIPYVMTNANYPQIGAPTLRLNDEKGAFMAVEHLAGLGHRRIAGIFHCEILQGIRRMNGFINAMKYCGLSLKSQWVGSYNVIKKDEQIPVLIRTMFDLPASERPTAIVCFNDDLAVSMLDYFRSMGISIPDDLSIVSFDDSSLATATEVKLTTIAHPKEALGRAAAVMLLDAIEKRLSGLEDIVFEPKLIIRNSTAKCKFSLS